MTDPNNNVSTIDVERIAEVLPHRYPFLMVDRVIDYELGKWLKAIKNVTANEPQFMGHFPNHPVMPGVLILEALAQASGILAQLAVEQDPTAEPMFYLVKIDKARFSRIVVPGDQIVLEVTQKRVIRNMGLYDGSASVDGEVVARAEFLCAERAG